LDKKILQSKSFRLFVDQAVCVSFLFLAAIYFKFKQHPKAMLTICIEAVSPHHNIYAAKVLAGNAHVNQQSNVE
jgi:hypothetical protein